MVNLQIRLHNRAIASGAALSADKSVRPYFTESSDLNQTQPVCSLILTNTVCMSEGPFLWDVSHMFKLHKVIAIRFNMILLASTD